MHELKHRLLHVQERIVNAAEKSGRKPESVSLVAVTKTIPAETVKEAVSAGVTCTGENYIQEARKKIDALAACPLSWHFIGHLQSNKAKYAVRMFDLIHSVDSFKLACELDREANKIDKIQSILIQVNIAAEKSKSGIAARQTQQLVAEIAGLENIALKGLMTMPPFFDNPQKARPYFLALRDLRDRIINELSQDITSNISMEELSMGMTGDFEVAIEAGATLVRIGTAIFGDRK